MRNSYSPPRSTAYAEHGMACTSHPAASLTAIDILRAGGNAMDAAVAAAATLAVVEPMSTGVGGDVFCLYAPKGTSSVVAYNGSGRAPDAAEAEWFLENGIDKIEHESPHAVTVPGTIDAWCRLVEDHGNMEVGEVLRPAIHHAAKGYTIAPIVHEAWVDAEARLSRDANAKKILLVGGHAPKLGSRHTQPLLAKTLEAVARNGRDGFYTGWVAEDIVGYLEELGGLHTLDDFAGAKGEYVDSISTEMNGYRVHECPPNGQGIVALIMMNILKGYDIGSMDPLSADRLHLTIEAGRLAFRDRAEYVADPAMADIPVDALLSDAYAEMLRADIDLHHAMAEVPGPKLSSTPNTVYLAVIDKDRNAASFINSTYFSFGSARIAPKSGVVLQNRGSGFVIEPGHRNNIAPGKRPMHTIIPAMLTKGERVIMPFGVMGGDYQPWGHTHVLQNMLLYGMSPQEALDLPRFAHENGAAYMEPSIPPHVMHDLALRGHKVAITPETFGGGQTIWIDWDQGTLAGGTEPRKDGIALGY